MSEFEEQSQLRREKVARLREAGIDPYPAHFHRTATTAEARELLATTEAESAEPERVTVAGRVTSRRGQGKVSFADLMDWSGKLQLFLRADAMGDAYPNWQQYIDVNDIIGATGKLMRTRTGEPSLAVESFSLLSKSLHAPPDKRHGLTNVETRYRQRYLDLIANEEVRSVFKARSAVLAEIRRFFDARGFLEVETPVLQSVAGGAAARTFDTYYTSLDRYVHLRISLELYLKRLLVGGFEKVFEIGRVFRNEGVSYKHNPEFTLLESYEAYADYNDVMEMVEELIATLVRSLHGSTVVELENHTIDFAPPWPRVTLRDAIKERSGIDFVEYPDAASLRQAIEAKGLKTDPALGRGKLIDELLSHFVEPNLIQPIFLTEYPFELSPLAKKKANDPRFVERFEAFAGGIEIANAYSELNDPEDQRARFEEQAALRAAGDAEAEEVDEDFLTALEYGMPPAGGLGIGIDRLIALLTGQHSLREVILFPQLRTIR